MVAIRFSRNMHLTSLRYEQLFGQNILYCQLLQADPVVYLTGQTG